MYGLGESPLPIDKDTVRERIKDRTVLSFLVACVLLVRVYVVRYVQVERWDDKAVPFMDRHATAGSESTGDGSSVMQSPTSPSFAYLNLHVSAMSEDNVVLTYIRGFTSPAPCVSQNAHVRTFGTKLSRAPVLIGAMKEPLSQRHMSPKLHLQPLSSSRRMLNALIGNFDPLPHAFIQRSRYRVLLAIIVVAGLRCHELCSHSAFAV